MNNVTASELTVNGVTYVPKGVTPKGNRAVLVIDRGWIFAGDVERRDGRIYLTRAVWLFRWESVGFAAVVADPKKSKADIRPISDLEFPADAEIFCVPVSESWGL